MPIGVRTGPLCVLFLHTTAKPVPKSQRFEQVWSLPAHSLGEFHRNLSPGCPGDELKPAQLILWDSAMVPQEMNWTHSAHPVGFSRGPPGGCTRLWSPPCWWILGHPQGCSPWHCFIWGKRWECFSHGEAAIWQSPPEQPRLCKSPMCSWLLVNIFTWEFTTLGKEDPPSE